MKVAYISLLFLLSLSSIANAETYIHGNSLAEIVIEGATITIKYAQNHTGDTFSSPAPGGTIFEGGINKKTDEIGGTAYLFDRKCGVFPYSVYGRFEGVDWVLKLKGLAPVLDSKCRVVAYTPSGPNANLDFHKPE
jgi:hypothetical protein